MRVKNLANTNVMHWAGKRSRGASPHQLGVREEKTGQIYRIYPTKVEKKQVDQWTMMIKIKTYKTHRTIRRFMLVVSILFSSNAAPAPGRLFALWEGGLPMELLG